MKILISALALVLCAAPLAAQTASTGAIIGLIGKSMTLTRKADAKLTEALASDSKYFPEIQETFEKVLATHTQVSRDLRAAFALGQIPPGYDPTQPVAGMSSDAVTALDSNGFYYATVNAHRQLNARLAQVLETWTTNLMSADYDRYKQQLAQAVAILGYPQAQAGGY